MEISNKAVSNSVSDSRYQAALREMQARHFDEHETVHDGSGRSEELPRDLARRQAKELSELQKDRDKMSIVEWDRAYGSAVPSARLGASSTEVRPSRAVAFEKLTEPEALAKHPELQGAFEALRAMRSTLAERFPGNTPAQEHYGSQARSEVQRRLDAGQLVESPDKFKVREAQQVHQVPAKAGYQPGYQAGARGAAGAGDVSAERGR